MSSKNIKAVAVRRGFIYFLLSALLLSAIFMSYLLRSNNLRFMDVTGWIYYALSCVSHASLFSAIPLLLFYLPIVLAGGSQRLAGVLMCFGEVLVTTLFVVNGFVFAIYHFHINGLVLSLLTGPGATEIFVFSIWLWLKMVGILLLIVAVCAALLWCAGRLALRPWHRLYARGITFLLVITMAAQAMHIYGAATMRRSLLESTEYLPYYFPVRMNSTFERWGWIDRDQTALTEIGHGDASIAYPLNPIQISREDSLQLNIVIIGIDSWNWRTMTQECTPNIYAFSQHAERYDNHFSSSNGTRGGIFGLFTGLSSYYWDSFEYSSTQPLLVSQMRSQGYQIQAYPSATLASPPFAKMLFSGVQGLNISTKGDSPYERDCQLTRNFIADLERVDSTRPFFRFLFYDLPHAIALPESKLTHFKPTWQYADYTRLDNDTDPTPFFNLYRNCVWQVDSLVGLAIDAMRQRGLLERTVVVITGDHGQEFNENHKNYWGHSSNYSRAQTGVPMIYYYPGCQPVVRRHRTTHYDVSPTLLRQVLGVQNPPSDYSMGHLLNDSTGRPWHVMGNDLVYAFLIDDDRLVEKRGSGSIVVYDRQLNQLDNYRLNARQLNEAIVNMNRFYKK